MKILVTYASHYGSTAQYARWIAEALDCNVQESKTVSRKMLTQYDVLVHCGGLYAGGLNGIRIVTKNWDILSGKQVILVSCGLADPRKPEIIAHIEAGLSRVQTEEMQKKIRQFHLRGGIDYSRLNPLHRAMMAMLCSTLRKKAYENLSYDDRLMLDTYGKQIDFSDRDTVMPLIDYVQNGN